MERQHELGMKPKSDLFDIQAQVAESEYNLIANQNRKATALVTLKQAMNYEEEKEGLLDINVSSLSSALPQNQELDIKALYEKAQTDLPQANSAGTGFPGPPSSTGTLAKVTFSRPSVHTAIFRLIITTPKTLLIPISLETTWVRVSVSR